MRKDGATLWLADWSKQALLPCLLEYESSHFSMPLIRHS